MKEGFEHLSGESRYTRFFRQLERLTEDQLRYLTEIDYRNHFAWVVVILESDPPRERGVGVARWIRLKTEPEVAEVAVTVIDEFQRKGIGRTLLLLAARSAIERGVRTFRAWVLSQNTATLGMLREIGGRRGKWESGVVEMNVPLPDSVESLERIPVPLVVVPA